MSETLVEHNVDPSALTEGNEAIEARIQELRAELAQLESEAFRRDAWGMHDADESTQADLEAYFASRDYKDDNGRLHDATTAKFKSERVDIEEITAERNDSLMRMSLKELIAAGAEAHAADNMQLQAVIEDALVEKLAAYAEKYHWSAEAQSQHLEHAIDQIHGNAAAQAAADLEEFDDDEEIIDTPTFKEGEHIIWKGNHYVVESVGQLTDQAQRFIRLKSVYNDVPSQDTFEETLVKDGAEKASEEAIEKLDFNNGMDAIVANLVSGAIALEEAEKQVRELGNTTNQSEATVQHLVNALPEMLGSESRRAQIDDYADLFRDEEAADGANNAELNPDAPKTIREHVAAMATKPIVKAQVAMMNTGRSGKHENGNSHKRAWTIIGIGVAAVGLLAAWKYGVQPKLNGEATQTATDVASSAGKHANKLTHVQEQLIHAPGKYSYGHYEHVYGDQAAAEISKAVKRLHAAGVKVIEHGSGRDYWIEVPAKNGSMTSNTQRVVEVLATGRV